MGNLIKILCFSIVFRELFEVRNILIPWFFNKKATHIPLTFECTSLNASKNFEQFLDDFISSNLTQDIEHKHDSISELSGEYIKGSFYRGKVTLS